MTSLIFADHWDYAHAVRNWNRLNNKSWKYILWRFDDVIQENVKNKRCRIKNIKIKGDSSEL